MRRYIAVLAMIALLAMPAAAADLIVDSGTVDQTGGTWDAVETSNDATLNLYDDAGDPLTVTGETHILDDSTLNLYGGELQNSLRTGYLTTGTATFNMYGGVIDNTPWDHYDVEASGFVNVDGTGASMNYYTGTDTIHTDGFNVGVGSTMFAEDGFFRAEDKFGVSSGATATIEGGDFYGRWLVYGSMDISGGSFNSFQQHVITDTEEYDREVGGFYFRNSDDTAVVNITGGDFTGLAYIDHEGTPSHRPWFNGESPKGGQTTEIHIRGGHFAENQIMYGNYESKTYIYGTDFQVQTLEIPSVGIPAFPSYKPATVDRSAVLITCTLADGTPFQTEWRFWEEDVYEDDPDKFFNFGTIFDVEWRYEERWDQDIAGFDGWGWFPVVDEFGFGTPYFALGESFDGPGDDHWEGPLVLIDASQQEPIPEPATTVLLGLGALGGLLGLRRRA